MDKFRILPEYPSTPHLPHKPNMVPGDHIADNADFFNIDFVIEEKIDAANCGMSLVDGNPVIRNRNNILQKGYNKNTPAKKQFRSIWGWFYDNKSKFERLKDIREGLSVYGEWCLALHGIRYDKLPDYFIAFDLYDYELSCFLDPHDTRKLLVKSGFDVPPLVHSGTFDSWEKLEKFCEEPSDFSSTDKREGLYLKSGDGKKLVSRYKMVRTDFVQGCNWSKVKITKNKTK